MRGSTSRAYSREFTDVVTSIGAMMTTRARGPEPRPGGQRLGGAGSARGEDRKRAPTQLELGGGLGLRDHIALHEVAPQTREQAEALIVLDPFGHHPQAERMGELDGGAHQSRGCGSRSTRSAG